MNSFVRMLALGAILFGAYPNFAISGTEDDLNRLEEQRYAAAIVGDWPALDAILADEFYYNQASGNHVPKATYLEYLKTGAVKVKKAVRKDTQIKLYGDMAVVTGITDVDVTLKGEDKILHSRYLHVWAKKGQGWQLVARQATYLPEKK